LASEVSAGCGVDDHLPRLTRNLESERNMISKYGRGWIATPLRAIAKFLDATGISPNALTLIGFVLALVVAAVLALGYLFWGGVLLIFAALFDTLDGAVARYAGKTSVFGAFFDSVLDRFSEAVTLIGLMVYYLTTPDPRQPVLLLAAALVGSLMVSYTRARAEAVGVAIKEGFFQRTERIIALVVGLVLSPFLPWIMLVVLWILAIFTNLTAVQRIYDFHRHTKTPLQT
jgi:CDP-diacylglycerol--glycerol-3-phosphate 3-phosphatidyltransferase